MSEAPSTPPPGPDTLLRQALASRDIPCTHCGHNLRDCTSNRCPECGSPLRVVVEADRLAHRAWLPAAALTFIAIASAFTFASTIRWVIDMARTTWFVSTQPAGGFSTTMPSFSQVPVAMWFDATVLPGVALGAGAGAWLAWRAVRRHDRAGIARALWRCGMIAVILALLLLADAVANTIQYSLF